MSTRPDSFARLRPRRSGGGPSRRRNVVLSGRARGGRLPSRGRAFSLAETLISVVLTGGLMVAALNLVGDAAVGQSKTSDRGKGQLLAWELMTEILSLSYEDPNETPGFGIELSEGTANRADFDDVDDYKWQDTSPPEYKDGTVMSDLDGWTRSSRVVFVSPDDLTTKILTDQGAKRIIVTVKHNDVEVASIVAVRTGSADTLVKDPLPRGDQILPPSVLVE